MCHNYKLETGCKHGDTCRFRHVEAEEKPSKKSNKGGAKGSVDLWKESVQLGCVSQDTHPRMSILRKEGKLEPNHAVKFSKSTWHQIKILDRKGPSRGIILKVWTSWAWSLRAQVWGEGTKRNLAPRMMRPQSSMGLGVKNTSSRMRRKLRFTLLLKVRQRLRLFQNLQRNENSWLIPEHQCTGRAKKT